MTGVNYYIEVGQLIKDLRLKKKMTRKELAEDICSVSYISRIESGDRCPTSVILRQITTKLGVSPEYLFRAIESPSAVKVDELIKEMFHHMERFSLYDCYELINREEKKLQIESIHDLQIIKAVECISRAIINDDYESGIKDLNEILQITYNQKNNPTDIEFAIMSAHGLLLLMNGQKKEAYLHLTDLNQYMDKIECFHISATLPRHFVHLIAACIDTSNFDEARVYLDTAIRYCKVHNVHSILRELYFLSGELYFNLGQIENVAMWFNKALALHELIMHSDNEHFDMLTKCRLKNNESLRQYIKSSKPFNTYVEAFLADAFDLSIQ